MERCYINETFFIVIVPAFLVPRSRLTGVSLYIARSFGSCLHHGVTSTGGKWLIRDKRFIRRLVYVIFTFIVCTFTFLLALELKVARNRQIFGKKYRLEAEAMLQFHNKNA